MVKETLRGIHWRTASGWSRGPTPWLGNYIVHNIFKCPFAVVFCRCSRHCSLCVSSVWSQCTPASRRPPSAQPKQSAGIKRDFACRAPSWPWPLTRTCPPLRNELWRLRREPCGGQHGKYNTRHSTTRKIKWLIRPFCVFFFFKLLLYFAVSSCISNTLIPFFSLTHPY